MYQDVCFYTLYTRYPVKCSINNVINENLNFATSGKYLKFNYFCPE